MQTVPSNAVMWAGMVGFVMPVAISVIKQVWWPDWVKSLCAFLCCFAGAVGTAYFNGNFDGRDIVTCFLVTFTIAMGSYYGFWKPTGIAPRLEAATTI